MREINYLDTPFDFLSPQRQTRGERFEISESTEKLKRRGYVSPMGEFWDLYVLLGGLFVVGGFIYGVVLLVAMLIWM